jgi:hypothetical protein
MAGTGWGGKTPSTSTKDPVGSQIWGQGTPEYKAYTTYASPANMGYTSPTISSADWGSVFKSTLAAASAPKKTSLPAPKPVSTAKRSSGGYGGGGGGGGGAAAPPQLSQDQLNWYASLLKGAAPGQLTANTLDLPDWQDVNITPFDNQMYEGLRNSLGQAYASDSAAATGAYDQLANYLQSNYSNPYDKATYATSQNVPGQTQLAMQRMLASQGQNQNMANDTYRQGQSADQGFGNLLAILGSNENIAQRNRLSAVQADRGTTQRALDMARLQGNTGIGMQEGAAKQQWQQRADDRGLLNAQQRAAINQQEALANWQRQNEVGDTNVSNRAGYSQATLNALSQLLPQLIGTSLTLPDLAALGLA